MRKIFIYILCFATGTFLSSCDENDTANVSAITNYAVFEYDAIIVVPLGGTYDATVIATESGIELPVSSSGTVDTNTIGVYNIAYSAANSDGFDASITQQVIVHDPTIIGSDVSGEIQDVGRPEREGVISLINGTSSIFFVTDFAYVDTFPVYFQMDGDVISDIPQPYVFGNASIDLTYDPIARIFTVFIPDLPFTYTFQYK